MDPRRLRIGEWIAGAGGAALLAVTFLDWYDFHRTETYSAPAMAGVKTTWGSLSAWQAFSVVDVLLALTAALGIAVAVMAAAHDSPAVSLALASLLALVGLVVTVVVAVKAIWPPDDLVRASGVWFGLGACVVTTVGAFAAMRDERIPRAARVDVPVETLSPPEGGKA